MINEAVKFFQEYNETFDSGDMAAFSKMFAEPFVSVRPDGSIASMPTNDVAEGFCVYLSCLGFLGASGFDVR